MSGVAVEPDDEENPLMEIGDTLDAGTAIAGTTGDAHALLELLASMRSRAGADEGGDCAHECAFACGMAVSDDGDDESAEGVMNCE